MRLKQTAISLPSLRHCAAPAVLIGSLALIGMPAQADEGDVLRPYVGASMIYDDNILGATDEAMAFPAIDPRHVDKVSNVTRRVEAGLMVDKTIGLQRLTANVNVNRNSFSRFDTLDYTGRDLSANWNWHVGPRIEGNVGATHVRNLAPLDEYHLPVPNMRSQDRQYFNASWLFHPSYKVHGGVSHYELRFDIDPSAPAAVQAALRGAERTVNDVTFGADYVARSGSSVGLQYRHAEGRLENALASYDQDELKGKIDWRYSVKTNLQFLGGWVRWKNEAGADFSGVNARVNAYWSATRKLTFNGSVWREVSAVDEMYAAFALSNGISLSATWDLTEKIRLGADLQHQDRDYSISGSQREDVYRYGAINFTYMPTRNWRIQASVYRTERDSNLGIGNYQNNGASIGTRFEF